MYVGVILVLASGYIAMQGIPHVCGGDPHGTNNKNETDAYSPCMWG